MWNRVQKSLCGVEGQTNSKSPDIVSEVLISFSAGQAVEFFA